MVRFLRRWLHLVLAVTMLSYMSLCMYILVVTETSSSHHIIQLSGRQVEQNNSAKNWHFEESGHKHFHDEQNRRKRELARHSRSDSIFRNTTVPALFLSWLEKKKSVSNCQIDIFHSKLILMHDVILDRKLAFARAKGGEEIQQVINRKDDDETYVVKPGYFAVPYSNKISSSKCYIDLDGGPPHLAQWSKAVTAYDPSVQNHSQYKETFTVLLTRYEYANVYWTIVDLYNTFLTVTFLNESMNNTHMLLVDGHPFTPLDHLWSTILKNVSRPHQLPAVSSHRTMSWIFARQFSPMLRKNATLPLIRQFRDVVLQSFNVSLSHGHNCSHLNVLFIWRRNYVAHPRNPTGIIARKISNEADLLSAVRGEFPEYNVTGVQLDLLPMSHQLQLLAQTDILVGMHGAAFGFSVLLPTSSAVIELFPIAFNFNWHMKSLAKRSGHLYYRWRNNDRRLENSENKTTNVPPSPVISLIRKASENICSSKKESNISVREEKSIVSIRIPMTPL